MMRGNGTKRSAKWLICACLMGACCVMAGCSSSRNGVWYDSRYEDAMETAETVFHAGHPSQAEGQYQTALRYAVLANQNEAIYDAGFGLALMQLRQDHDVEALQSVETIARLLGEHNKVTKDSDGGGRRINTQRRGLDLIRATVFYRQKMWQKAQAAALLARQSKDKTIALQVVFLQGVIAYEQGDAASVQAAIAVLKGSSTAENKINRQELEACSALLRRDWAKAEPALDELVQARRGQEDYSAMRRALLLQSHAVQQQGQWAEANNLKEQARQSAWAEHTNPITTRPPASKPRAPTKPDSKRTEPGP